MKIALAAALAVLGLGTAVAFAGVGRAGGAHPTLAAALKQQITVTATGTVEHAPDQAQLVFSVVSQAAAATNAMTANSVDTAKVIAALEHAGVDAKDIQTQDVSLQPTYRDDGNSIDGYTASNSVNVTSSIGRAGALVDTGVSAGANQVSGPTLSVGDQDALYRDALKSAVAAARLKAQAIAAAAGVDVGTVTSVVEGQTDGGEPLAWGAAMSKDAAVPAPIAAGTQDIQASVTVTFAIG
jgi:uncharacterized protein